MNGKQMLHILAMSRSTIPLVTIVPMACLLALAIWVARFSIWPAPTLADLKYPVIVVPPDNQAPYIRTSADELQRGALNSNSCPANETVVIDSDFNIYQEQNVKCNQSDLSISLRYLVRPGSQLTYSVCLKRDKQKGCAAAVELISCCDSLGGDINDHDRRRCEIERQTTLQGIIAVLQSDSTTAPQSQESSSMPQESGEQLAQN